NALAFSSRSTYPGLFLSGVRVSYRPRRGLSIVVARRQVCSGRSGFCRGTHTERRTGIEEHGCTSPGRTGFNALGRDCLNYAELAGGSRNTGGPEAVQSAQQLFRLEGLANDFGGA